MRPARDPLTLSRIPLHNGWAPESLLTPQWQPPPPGDDCCLHSYVAGGRPAPHSRRQANDVTGPAADDRATPRADLTSPPSAGLHRRVDKKRRRDTSMTNSKNDYYCQFGTDYTSDSDWVTAEYRYSHRENNRPRSQTHSLRA